MNEICPNCRAVRNLRLEFSSFQKTKDGGKEIEVRVKSYYCETCGMFVKSEEEPAV